MRLNKPRPVRPVGVPVAELRAAVDLARLAGTDAGVCWPPREWERLWVRLTPAMQSVVYLHVLVGLNHAEVGRQLGVRRGSVVATYARALDRIRDAAPARE